MAINFKKFIKTDLEEVKEKDKNLVDFSKFITKKEKTEKQRYSVETDSGHASYTMPDLLQKYVTKDLQSFGWDRLEKEGKMTPALKRLKEVGSAAPIAKLVEKDGYISGIPTVSGYTSIKLETPEDVAKENFSRVENELNIIDSEIDDLRKRQKEELKSKSLMGKILSTWSVLSPGSLDQKIGQKELEKRNLEVEKGNWESKLQTYEEDTKNLLSRIDRNVKSFVVGAGGTIEGMLGAAEWIAPESTKPFFEEKGDQVAAWREITTPGDQQFVDKLIGGTGSFATFFIPGLGVMKGTSLIANVSPKLALLFGSSVSALLESSVEAGSVYRELSNSGLSEKQASLGATKTFIANSILVSLTNKLGIFSDAVNSGIIRLVMSSGMEGLQEYWQEVIANVVTSKDPFSGAFESGMIGAIIGAPAGVIGGELNNSIQKTEIEHLANEAEIKSKSQPNLNLTKIEPKELKTLEKPKLESRKKTTEIPEKKIIDKLEKNINFYQQLGTSIADDIQPQNAALRDLKVQAKDEEVITYTQKQIKENITPNEDGTITLYRVGEPTGTDRLVSATYDKKVADDFAKAVEATKDTKTITNQYNVKPEDIGIFIGGEEAEVLIENSSIQSKETKPEVKPIEKELIKTAESFSKHYERIKEEFGFGEEGVEYENITNKDQAKRAYDYIQRNPNKAMRIAYGFDKAPSKINAQAIRQSLVASLRASGKINQAEEISRIVSKEFTKAAQTLNLAKLEVSPTDKPRITQNITDARLEKLGNSLGEIDAIKAVELAKEHINKKSHQAAKDVVEDQKDIAKNNLEDLDNLINKIIC